MPICHDYSLSAHLPVRTRGPSRRWQLDRRHLPPQQDRTCDDRATGSPFLKSMPSLPEREWSQRMDRSRHGLGSNSENGRCKLILKHCSVLVDQKLLHWGRAAYHNEVLDVSRPPLDLERVTFTGDESDERHLGEDWRGILRLLECRMQDSEHA